MVTLFGNGLMVLYNKEQYNTINFFPPVKINYNKENSGKITTD